MNLYSFLQFVRNWWIEFFISCVAAFFFFRELGTFPSPWIDEGLFLLIARSLAEGKGYSMPVLDFYWNFPNFVTAGPLLVLPVALFIKLFGFSMVAARVPMALYLVATSTVFYLYTRRITNKIHARWATLLLVTLSAFVNTGKPVMGEIPGFFYFLLAMFCWQRGTSRKHAICTGLFFGIAIVAKLTYGLLFPALGLTWLLYVVKRNRANIEFLTIVGAVSLSVFTLWYGFTALQGNFSLEMKQYAFGHGGSTMFYPLIHHLDSFFRFQFVYFDVLLIFAAIGSYAARKKLGTMFIVFLWLFVLWNILHVLSKPFAPWYRYFLPAHLAFLPLVPMGIYSVLRQKFFVHGLLLFFIAAQAYWQYDYRGSSRTDEAFVTTNIIQESYADTQLLIVESEVYVMLPQDNPNWVFLTRAFNSRKYDVLAHLPVDRAQYDCYPILRRMSMTEQRERPDEIVPLYKRYVLEKPSGDCPTE